MISHGNILANLEPLEAGMQPYLKWERFVHPLRFLDLVPVSHVFGQFMGVWIPPLLGGCVYFQDSLNPSEIISTIRHERVSVLVAVPRVLEALQGKIERDLDAEGALETFRKDFDAAENEKILRRMWRFRKIHRRFGWKFWAVISGGATLDPGNGAILGPHRIRRDSRLRIDGNDFAGQRESPVSHRARLDWESASGPRSEIG